MSPAGSDGSMERIMDAVKTLLEGVGEDIGREGLLDTPKVPTESPSGRLLLPASLQSQAPCPSDSAPRINRNSTMR